MHFAAQSQSADVAEMLLEAGATVDVGDGNGNTALFTAVFHHRGDPATLRALLPAGAAPWRKNLTDVSPRGLAEVIGNYDVAMHVRGVRQLLSSSGRGSGSSQCLRSRRAIPFPRLACGGGGPSRSRRAGAAFWG
ncbi:ankyrin repeat domain-containing protein [Streptomyces sp. NPDC049597]|uniref:ankyrin repeat domain-containing protein n=1 Tax=Streptomyces sp. NPDC049597 TaxID=3155276 RepID=UPI0034166601